MNVPLSILCSLLFVTVSSAGTVTIAVKPEIENKSANRKKEEYTTAHWLNLRITNSSNTKLEGVTLKWSLYAANLRRGADTVSVEKSGEMKITVDASGRYLDVATPKVVFVYSRTHGEWKGVKGFRTVEESGKKYHGYHVQVISGDTVLGEAVSESVKKELK